MKITANEAITLGIWDELCTLKGINVWAVNEGLMDGNTEIKLTLEEAQEVGILDLKEEK